MASQSWYCAAATVFPVVESTSSSSSSSSPSSSAQSLQPPAATILYLALFRPGEAGRQATFRCRYHWHMALGHQPDMAKFKASAIATVQRM
uniref:Uncharacterized protein n=1 Tax=Oryza brachyantha TaxID=4533 RepID=J3LX83_ORYBR